MNLASEQAINTINPCLFFVGMSRVSCSCSSALQRLVVFCGCGSPVMAAAAHAGAGLIAHTHYEEGDLNTADRYLDDAAHLKVEPETVDLAVQLINRQTAKYDPADLEDRYETRLRAMIDAKLAGMPMEGDQEKTPL